MTTPPVGGDQVTWHRAARRVCYRALPSPPGRGQCPTPCGMRQDGPPSVHARSTALLGGGSPVLFRVLGAVDLVRSDGVRVSGDASKPWVLLSTLLLHAGEWVRVDRLADALWSAAPPA